VPLGFDRDANVINLTDTADVYAYITDQVTDAPIPQDDLVQVEFTIAKPDGTEGTFAGEIQETGTGFYRYADTDQVGEYKVVAQFTTAEGSVRSIRADFEVIDPFNPPAPTSTQVLGLLVWQRLEDLFDSEEGGPWLQDVTMATFKKEKMEIFVNDGLFDINQQNPPTNLILSEFITDDGTTNANTPLLVQGVLVSVIRHLMRSYTEQPEPRGAQVVYEDRRDYLQRWGTLLQVEQERYLRWLALWKRQFLGLGHSKVLVDSKAGRLIPAPLRTRYVGRGYY
jgi:hypothetical protein